MRSGDCDVISLYVLYCSVNGSVHSVCCVFVNCLVKQFGIADCVSVPCTPHRYDLSAHHQLCTVFSVLDNYKSITNFFIYTIRLVFN